MYSLVRKNENSRLKTGTGEGTPVLRAADMARGLLVAAAGTAGALVVATWWYRRMRERRRVIRNWPELGVEVRRSQLSGAGDGLFAARDFAKGEVLGEYYGLVLSLLQAYRLEDRDYLMGGFGPNAHIDARLALNAPGRYVNDHFDKACLNARFEKDKAARRAKLLSTRPICRGEEIYASYGANYWRARGIDPETGGPLKAAQ